MTEPAAYSVQTLAKRWGCSRTHIYTRIRGGELRHFRFGTLIRIPRVEVERIEACGSSYTGGSGVPSPERTEKPSEPRLEPQTEPRQSGDSGISGRSRPMKPWRHS